MACLLTWKNVVPVFLKSTRALLQVPHRKFTPGSCGDSSSRVPKEGNRSSETARNFLRSAFRLLKFFSANWTLENVFSTFNNRDYCHQNKVLQWWRHFVFAITTLRLIGHAAARAEVHPVATNKKEFEMKIICLISLLYWSLSEGFLGWFDAFWVRNWRFYFLTFRIN